MNKLALLIAIALGIISLLGALNATQDFFGSIIAGLIVTAISSVIINGFFPSSKAK